jgi:hypothetical protein
LAFSIGLRSRHHGRIIFLGLVGACLGAALYEVIGAMIDPLAETSDPISGTWPTRLIARVLVAMGAGGAISLAGLSLQKGQAPEPARELSKERGA